MNSRNYFRKTQNVQLVQPYLPLIITRGDVSYPFGEASSKCVCSIIVNKALLTKCRTHITHITYMENKNSTFTSSYRKNTKLFTMKGAQGLEALATLCGGATKAPDNDNPSQNHTASDQNAPAPAAQVPQVQIPRQLDHFANSSFNNHRPKNDPNNTQTQQQQQQQQQVNQMNPQLAALINAGLTQQNNMTNKMSPNDSAMALQQMVYLNLLQQNQSNVSKILNQQQQQPASPQFVDQNTLAMVLALQQQQKAQHDAGEYH